MTGIDICEAVAGRIAALWPERVLYRDFCPADHQRPSGYLYITRDGYTSLNALLVRWDVEIELELFCSTDAYDISSTEELRREQAEVLEAFPVPVPVGRRRVAVSASGDGMEQGSAYVKFTASWVEGRPAGLPGLDEEHPGGAGQDAPLMEHFAWDHGGKKRKDEET